MQQLLDCADALRLREILPHGRFIGTSDIRVRSCCSDPRSCRPGDVYVAIVDADGDGHDEVDKAVARGAMAVVSERLLPTRVPCCVVPDSREAYGQHLSASGRSTGPDAATGGRDRDARQDDHGHVDHRGAAGSGAERWRHLFARLQRRRRPPRRPRPRPRPRTNWLAGSRRWSRTAVRTVWWKSRATRWRRGVCRACPLMRPS